VTISVPDFRETNVGWHRFLNYGCGYCRRDVAGDFAPHIDRFSMPSYLGENAGFAQEALCSDSSLVMLLALSSHRCPQDPNSWLADLPHAKDYVQKRVSSYDRSGGICRQSPDCPRQTSRLLEDGVRADQSYVVSPSRLTITHHLKVGSRCIGMPSPGRA